MTKNSPIDLSLPQWRDEPQLLKDELVSRLTGPIVIKADLPRPVDTLIVQLLVAARRETRAAGTEFRIEEASVPFCEGLRTLGLFDEILG